MYDKQRHRRLRLLIRKLNKDRKKQSRKIDILCNDLISAQRNFIKRLGVISFAANFYESIIGMTDLNRLLQTAVEFIKAENEDTNVTFFLRQDGDPILQGPHLAGTPFCTNIAKWEPAQISQNGSPQKDSKVGTQEGFELHMFESDRPTAFEKQYIESCFTQELMDNISKSNKVCTLDDMYAMGLHGNLSELNKISAVAIPLGLLGLSLGFILVFSLSEYKLTADEVDRISAVISGLSRAITSCQTLSRIVD